jgi:hypothetical protein
MARVLIIVPAALPAWSSASAASTGRVYRSVYCQPDPGEMDALKADWRVAGTIHHRSGGCRRYAQVIDMIRSSSRYGDLVALHYQDLSFMEAAWRPAFITWTPPITNPKSCPLRILAGGYMTVQAGRPAAILVAA